ncbi:MAG: topoisomerase DNA-binding C4 zinc finger domain-containing protein, partial [Candidatus Omnitrophica bacterium]|nr:topoisomerase DNA-binding C4 zinc finger domain-containing protein [Candidatus Omnitrophota bacterium]
RMEDELDKIASGELNWTVMLDNFYRTYKSVLDKAYTQSKEIREFLNQYMAEDRKCPRCGAPLIMRKGQHGVFLGCSRFPQCRYSQSEVSGSLSGRCPRCGGALILKKGKYGQFLACSAYPSCRYTKRLAQNAHHSGH